MPRPPDESEVLAHLFDAAPGGYVVLDRGWVITRANAEFLRLAGVSAEDVVGRRTLGSLMTVGARILAETHLAPILEHDGVVREVALEIVRPDRGRVPVILNATRSGAEPGSVLVVIIEARDRHRYEDNLLASKREAERAVAYAASVAETLQQTLIPPRPPDVAHLDIDGLYRPAGKGREVGGDFYDVFQVGPDEWFIALGDVSGKGIPAAVVTSFVRHTVRSLAIVHRDPAEVLRLLDEAMQTHESERYCTVVLVHLLRAEGRWQVSVSLAGHPPAMIRRPDGEIVELGEPGPPVGLVLHPEFHTVRFILADETVLLYTDGVTEARSSEGMFGEDRLFALVRESGREPAAITANAAGAALDWQSNDASDDIAVVAFAARRD